MTMTTEHNIVSPFEGNSNNSQRLSFPSSAMSILSSEMQFRDTHDKDDYDASSMMMSQRTSQQSQVSQHTQQHSTQLLYAPDLTKEMKIPTTQDEADVIDAALADEMNKLNMTDYDKINFEVYGINEDIDENQTPYFLENKYLELEFEIQKQIQKSMLIGGFGANRFKKSMIKTMKYVLNKYPNYVNDKKFRLAFLRSARFDVKLAAEKIIRHFSQKQDLFGNNGEILGRDVKLLDLSKTDMIVLESGLLQILPIRDTGGRFIFVIRPEIFSKLVKENNGITVTNMIRVWFYIWSVYGFQNIEFQKKGMVVILYIVGMSTTLLPLAKEIGLRRDSSPNKVVSIHICYDKKTLRPWMAAHKLYSLSKRNRVRLRKHYGDHGEAIFKLQTYGIPVNDIDHFPINGIVPLKLHYEWLMKQKYYEQQQEQIQEQSYQGQALQSRQSYQGLQSESQSLNPNLLLLPDVSNSNFIVDIDIVEEADLNEILLLGEDDEVNDTNTNDIVNVNVNVNNNNNNNNTLVISNSNIVEPLVEADNTVTTDEGEGEGYNDNDDSEEFDNVTNNNNIAVDVVVPTKNDVLFGKGKSIKNHYGNIQCMKLIITYQIEYEKAGKFAKTDISERIITIIHDEYDGKFLKFNIQHNNWEEVERMTAREKISHYFRHIRKTKKTNNANTNTTANSASTSSPSTAATIIISSASSASSASASASSITSSSIKRDVPLYPSSSLLSSSTTTTTMINDGSSSSNSNNSEQHNHYEQQRFWKKSRA